MENVTTNMMKKYKGFSSEPSLLYPSSSSKDSTDYNNIAS